MNSEP